MEHGDGNVFSEAATAFAFQLVHCRFFFDDLALKKKYLLQRLLHFLSFLFLQASD
jgi:hypothetical protein